MKKLQLTLESGNPITFFLNNNFCVCSYVNNNNKKVTSFQDGNHNNGGWSVKESYEQVLQLIEEALLT